MRLVLRTLVLGAAAASVVACSKETGGTPVTLDPLSAVRYVNAVADTGALDFRVIDIVGDAPNAVSAAFRTGGLPYGAANNVLTQPPYQAVRAGTRQIRVFMNGTTPAIASQIVFDTTFNFVEGRKYTFLLTGYARTGSTPAVQALIVYDSVPTIAAGRWALRVINAAPDVQSSVNQPANVLTPLDASVALANTGVPEAGAAAFANLGFRGVSSYVAFDTSSIVATGQPYRLRVVATGVPTPTLAAGVLPIGVRGNSTDNPTPGTRVVGSALTAVIMPRSVPGSPAPATPAAVTVDTITRSNDTVTVVRPLVAATATACAAPTAIGTAVNEVVTVTGAAQAEYGGNQVVIAAVAGTAAGAFPGCAPAAVRARFRYRAAGAPVSPATGTAVFRVAESGLLRAANYATPAVIYLLDQRPPNTAP